MTTCSKCSTQNLLGANYCARCGAKLGNDLSSKKVALILLAVVTVLIVFSSLHSDQLASVSNKGPAPTPTADSMTAKQHSLHKKSLVIQNLSDTDCGLPPHSAERLGLSGSDLQPLFLRLSLRKKVIKKNLAESHRHPALCGGEPQPDSSCSRRSNTLRYFSCKARRVPLRFTLGLKRTKAD